MAWIKRGSIMVDIQNVERLDKVLKDGSVVARIVGWINEGVVQIPLLNTFWFYDFLRRVNKEWLLKRHPDMVIFEGTPEEADLLYDRLRHWLSAPSYQIFDVDYEIGLHVTREIPNIVSVRNG